ncbi:MAG: phytoene desaturase family protein [Bacteroidales bacterium]|nr:phytoene desaturase family protein [Bacteroidales bacterium]
MEAGKVLIVGTGIAGLSGALRLVRRGFKVEMLEKNGLAGGRMNLLEKDGFKFDTGPTFFSMSYEFRELAGDLSKELPFELMELDPIYTVWYDEPGKRYTIYKDLEKLAAEFEKAEPGFREKMEAYLKSTGKLYHDTESLIIKNNFDSLADYAATLVKVPMGHLPKLFRTFWKEVSRYFESDDVREIVSLVSFFLGGTPFDTPSVFTMLSYTEFVHDGYYNVKGGMYNIVKGFVKMLEDNGVKIHYNTEIVGIESDGTGLQALVDRENKKWKADIYVINSDAALFRGRVLKRSKYSEERLDKKRWTMAPFTIYLGVDMKLPELKMHNYFLRGNFKEYADNIYRNQASLEQAYYYVNVVSRLNTEAAPEGKESLFILCPVPDLRFKTDWSDKEEIAGAIIKDLSRRTAYDLENSIISKTILTPEDWRDTFNLHRGSGLGLGHNMMQMGYLRPSNKDEKFDNLFYTGSSTLPGTGIPMAIISSKLVTERIEKKYGSVLTELH